MMSRGLRWGLAIGLLALTGVGVAGLAVRLSRGLILANFSSVLPWGLWLSLYIYFIGLSAGSFLLSTLVYVFGVKRYEPVGRIALFQALGCLLLGICFILLDLGRPERFWRTLTNWSFTSVLAWEILFYMAYIIILLVEMWILLRHDLTSRWPFLKRLHRGGHSHPFSLGDRRVVKILATIGIPVAIGVHGGTGMIFAVVKARPFWHTGLFPIIFLVSAMVSGGALLTFLTAFLSRIERNTRLMIVRSLAQLVAFFLLFDVFIQVIEIIVVLYGNISHHTVPFMLMLAGPYWWVFWIVEILIGAVIPLWLIFARRTGGSLKWLGLACLLIFVGVVGVRLNIVIPAQQLAWYGGLPAEYQALRNPSGYFPSGNEWLSSLGLLCLGLWGLWLGRKVLPLEASQDMAGDTASGAEAKG